MLCSSFDKSTDNAAQEITFHAPIRIDAPADPTNPFATITGLFVDEIKPADAELSSVKIQGVVCGTNKLEVDQVETSQLTVEGGNISFQNTDVFNPTTFSVARNVGNTEILSPNVQIGPTQVGTGSTQVNLNGNITVSSNVNANAVNATNVFGTTGVFTQGIYAPNLFISQGGGGFIQFP